MTVTFLSLDGLVLLIILNRLFRQIVGLIHILIEKILQNVL